MSLHQLSCIFLSGLPPKFSLERILSFGFGDDDAQHDSAPVGCDGSCVEARSLTANGSFFDLFGLAAASSLVAKSVHWSVFFFGVEEKKQKETQKRKLIS